jgi:hypothetical protein
VFHIIRRTEGSILGFYGGHQLIAMAYGSSVAPQLLAALREREMPCFVRWNHLFPVPPLSISKTELRDGLHILDEVLDIADAVLPGK